MDGGTFTISNGGVFGSLMGTPIINPPQSAILGMHGIFDRPVAINGKVRIFLQTYGLLTWRKAGPVRRAGSSEDVTLHSYLTNQKA